MSTSTLTTKQRMVDIIESQPDDSSFDEILRELAFARMIERGLADVDAGRTVSHEEVCRLQAKVDQGLSDIAEGRVLDQEEVERRMARWLTRVEGA